MLRALDKLNAPVIYGDIFTTDIFYRDDLEVLMKWKDTGVLGVDMETAMLYAVGRKFDVNVLSILSVSDHILSQQETTAQERETGFTDMMELSLDLFNAL
ncbi:Purine nucleoside phosphorylase DeoD-type like protein [Aduncisulcus paluster]|uniref:Purine nucleoside phosphorylase DeoD-type like protein n=1 Tax=Aduncisulcus paluster TaxID=2918883 RepID=A0ABQ5JX91_9EUKA|nr:Purine nucleoside phosphorylase DeoD-type like protein [Aduncisulcus paluster]